MGTDRQAIERRDFPIARRGYDPAAVDAHLQALATEIERLERQARGGAESSLAASAGTQIQGILQAAETTARDIERQAQQSAKTLRESAERDARLAREEAVKRSRVHVAAVAQATKLLLERIGSMDAEISALAERLRTGANRLIGDLDAIDASMEELYEASSGRSEGAAEHEPALAAPETAEEEAGIEGPPLPAAAASDAPPQEPEPASEPPAGEPEAAPAAAEEPSVQPGLHPDAPRSDPGAEPRAADKRDVEGARLIALNMALNGESREDASRYLAEHFQLVDRQGLIDEVYASVEG